MGLRKRPDQDWISLWDGGGVVGKNQLQLNTPALELRWHLQHDGLGALLGFNSQDLIDPLAGKVDSESTLLDLNSTNDLLQESPSVGGFVVLKRFP